MYHWDMRLIAFKRLQALPNAECSIKYLFFELNGFDFWIISFEMNLTSRTELFVNVKRVELELKNKFVSNSSRVSSWTNSYQVEPSLDEFESTRLISSPKSTGQLHRLSWVNKTQLQLTRGYSCAYTVIWICIKGWCLVRLHLHDKHWLNLQVMKVFSWCKIVGKRFPICHVHMDDTIVEVGRLFLTLKKISYGLNFLCKNVCLIFFFMSRFSCIAVNGDYFISRPIRCQVSTLLEAGRVWNRLITRKHLIVVRRTFFGGRIV